MNDIISKVTEKSGRILNMVIGFFEVGHARENPHCRQPELVEQIKEAHRDWVDALDNFNYPIEDDMVDYAIYNVNAAEKKYAYLIKKARNENITLDVPKDLLE